LEDVVGQHFQGFSNPRVVGTEVFPQVMLYHAFGYCYLDDERYLFRWVDVYISCFGVDLVVGFVSVASLQELKPGDLKGVEAGGKEIVLVNVGGEIFALGNRCTHMSCMLSDGSLKEDGLRCPCHDSVFDPRTGRVVRGPARKPESVYEVRVEGDQIQINV
jgi:nitrite reductase/ring-hydroxylating ferredoxin subunit